MLATADQLIASMGLSRSSTDARQVAAVAACDVFAPIASRLVKKYVGYAVEEASFTEYHPLISSRPSLSQGFVEDDMILAYEGSPQGARPIRQGRGNSRDTLSLRNLPIRSVTSIYENFEAWLDPGHPDGVFPSSTLLSPGTDYQVDYDGYGPDGLNWSKSGFVFRIGAIWALQARTVKVTYTAGYSADELTNDFPEFMAAALETGQHLVVQSRMIGYAVGGAKAGLVVGEAMDDYSVKFQTTKGLDTLMYDLPPGAKRILDEHVRMSKFL